MMSLVHGATKDERDGCAVRIMATGNRLRSVYKFDDRIMGWREVESRGVEAGTGSCTTYSLLVGQQG